METVVVSDTNIFIDLISVDLLDEFFRLPFEIHTTDFIIHELKEIICSNQSFKHTLPTTDFTSRNTMARSWQSW